MTATCVPEMMLRMQVLAELREVVIERLDQARRTQPSPAADTPTPGEASTTDAAGKKAARQRKKRANRRTKLAAVAAAAKLEIVTASEPLEDTADGPVPERPEGLEQVLAPSQLMRHWCEDEVGQWVSAVLAGCVRASAQAVCVILGTLKLKLKPSASLVLQVPSASGCTRRGGGAHGCGGVVRISHGRLSTPKPAEGRRRRARGGLIVPATFL